jgi:hypothetical protein
MGREAVAGVGVSDGKRYHDGGAHSGEH